MLALAETKFNTNEDLVLMKRDMLRYVQDMRVVREMGHELSDPYVVLCKVRMVGA